MPQSHNDDVFKFEEINTEQEFETQFEIDNNFSDLNCHRRRERAAKLIEDRKIKESKRHTVQFEMQLAGPNDDISEILSRNLFQQHKPLVYSHDEQKPDFDEDMLCK